MGLAILGIGHAHPPHVIDNAFLRELDIGTTEAWILERVGIQTRRTALPLDYIRQDRNLDPRASFDITQSEYLKNAIEATDMALRRAGVDRRDIGYVIAGGSAPRYASPSEACVLASALGINAPALTLNSACTTFVAQLHVLSLMDAARIPDYILLLLPENLTRSLNYNDRASAVLLGDCTVAVVVSATKHGRFDVEHCSLGFDCSSHGQITIAAGDHLVQNGPVVHAFAIRQTTFLLNESGYDSSDWFIGHQANLRMLDAVCRRVGVSRERHLSNVQHFGNTGSAGAPSVLSQHWDRFRTGEKINCAVVGAGLSWGNAILTTC